MPCDPVGQYVPGVRGFICRRGRSRPKQCAWCARPSAYLCDAPVTRRGKAATCDRALCAAHAQRVSDNRDLCPQHAETPERRQPSFAW